MPEIIINGRSIGPNHSPFIIAEAGINHNGELEKALQMVGVAKQAGADVIKFQTFKADEFIGDPNQQYTYLSQGREITESMLNMFRRYELSRNAWFEIKSECDRQDILFMSTPQNRSDLDLLLEIGIPAIKVGSDDFTNLPLLRSYAETCLPIILSCGMSDLADVYRSLETIGALDGYPTVLMLCTSQYPTPHEDVNLRKLFTLQNAFPFIVLGFSDHTQGVMASSMAVAYGASAFEKHFTLSHHLPGPDHWFSEDINGLADWIKHIHIALEILGSAIVRPTHYEKLNKKEFQRVLVASEELSTGDILTPSKIAMRRIPGGIGLPATFSDLIIGHRVNRHYSPGEVLEL